MPRSDPMNWDSRGKRWRKMFKGILIEVYAHELGGTTQDNTRSAMRDWWREKLIELMKSQGILKGPPPIHSKIFDANPPPKPVAPPKQKFVSKTENTVGELVETWLSDRKSEALAGTRSNNSYLLLTKAAKFFVDHVGKNLPVDRLNAIVWDDWYRYCAGLVALRDRDQNSGWTPATAKTYFMATRQFVNWLWERESIREIPRNFHSKNHRFERPTITIPTFTNEEISLLLNGAIGVHKLLMLLMLNCGFTQKDVSDLKRSEVDLVTGRITRIRSKTSLSKSGRMVSYKLWDCTLTLLKNHIATTGDRALVTKSGQPWVWSRLTSDGKYSCADNIGVVFNMIKQRISLTGEHKTLKIFRKTSATRIRSNRDFADLRFWFLGHSETTVADRHYAALSQQALDNAVTWLGTQYDLD